MSISFGGRVNMTYSYYEDFYMKWEYCPTIISLLLLKDWSTIK